MSTLTSTDFTFAPKSAFAEDLVARARAYFAARGEHRFADPLQWAQGAGVLGLFLALYAIVLAIDLPILALLALLPAMGVLIFMFAATLGHDATHGCVSPRRWVNETITFLAFALAGISGPLWRDRHVRVHHTLPNVRGTGIDADSTAVIRLAPDKQHRWWHRLQPLYAIPMYLVGGLHSAWVYDFQCFVEERRARPQAFGGWGPLASFAATKVFHASAAFALPLVAGHSWLTVLGAYVLVMCVVSACFAVLVIGTHVHDDAAFPEPDADGSLPMDWATLQLETSIDWAPTSMMALRLTGGANAHAAHHLFPGHSHRHGAALTRLIHEVAGRHGLRPRVTSFAGLVGSHWRHLVRLAQGTSRDETRPGPPSGR